MRQLEEAAEEARDFTPMAYNPAAPAAPESIRPREKTPPPEDGDVNPLAAAVAYDQQPFAGGVPPPPPGQPGPPGPGARQFGGHPGLQRASTMPVHGGPPGAGAPYGGFQAPQHGTPPAGAQGMPGPPPGGPAGYPYSQQQPQGYNVHQQFYRPQEGEQHAVRVQEQGGTRLERGVGGVLKKFEKRFG